MKFLINHCRALGRRHGDRIRRARCHLVQKPAMNKTEIVFSCSGDLWRVGREGGVAARLTSGPGFESDAAFSPDGKNLAFTGESSQPVAVHPSAGGGAFLIIVSSMTTSLRALIRCSRYGGM